MFLWIPSLTVGEYRFFVSAKHCTYPVRDKPRFLISNLLSFPFFVAQFHFFFICETLVELDDPITKSSAMGNVQHAFSSLETVFTLVWNWNLLLPSKETLSSVLLGNLIIFFMYCYLTWCNVYRTIQVITKWNRKNNTFQWISRRHNQCRTLIISSYSSSLKSI